MAALLACCGGATGRQAWQRPSSLKVRCRDRVIVLGVTTREQLCNHFVQDCNEQDWLCDRD